MVYGSNNDMVWYDMVDACAGARGCRGRRGPNRIGTASLSRNLGHYRPTLPQLYEGADLRAVAFGGTEDIFMGDTGANSFVFLQHFYNRIQHFLVYFAY